MSPELIGVLLGASFTLVGVLIGNAVSLLQTKKQRDWQVEDARRVRRQDILDSRVVQSEVYAEAVTQDFRLLMNDIEFILFTNDRNAATQRTLQVNARKDAIDARVFAKGPSISALADTPLSDRFQEMMKALDALQAIYVEVCLAKIDQRNHPPTRPYRTRLDTTWRQFAKSLGRFYARLDRIRIARAA